MKNIRNILAVAIFTLLGFVLLGNNKAYAATKTWTGGAGVTDRKWSTANNWSPSGAPVNGDEVVINGTGTSNSRMQIENDISSLSLSKITFTGSASEVQMKGSQVLTLTGDVINSATDGDSGLVGGTIILGANVVVDGVGIEDYLGAGELQLNGHTLTIKYSNVGLVGVISISVKVTGSGNLTVDTGSGDVSISGANTYSGTTRISSGSIANYGSGAPDYSTMFGASNLVVAGSATLHLEFDKAGAFNNKITFEPATQSSGEWGQQLLINNTNRTSAFTVSIPNITLQGNTRFSTLGNSIDGEHPNMTVNLAGITANGHCVQYGGEANLHAGMFQNGPAACVIGDGDRTSGVPKAPNTGDGSSRGRASLFIISATVALVATVGGVFAARKGSSQK